MQKAYKSLLAIVLTLTLLFSMSACGNKSESDTSGKAETSAAQQETTQETKQIDKMGKYEPGIEITTVKYQDDVAKFYDGEDFENNIYTRSYLKDLGIKIKVLWSVPTSQYEQRLNLSIASNEMPDICEVNDVQFSKLAKADMLADMTSHYADYITDYAKANIEGDGGIGLKKYTVGGKLMALPRMDATYDSTPMLWIRSDWMKKLGLQAPKTVDEFHALADSFTTKDPDGNGKADTVGFAFEKALFGEFATLNGYFNSYGAYTQSWIKDGSGQLVFGGIQPQVKSALGKLAEMFKAGTLDKEFGVKDGGKIAELASSGKLGMFYGAHWNAFWPAPDCKKNNPDSEWLPYSIPSADGSGSKPEVKIGVKSAFAISKNMKNPEAAIKLMNYFWDVNFNWSPKFTTIAYHAGYADAKNPKVLDPNKPNGVGFKAAVLFGNSPTQNIDIHSQWLKYLQSKNLADCPMLISKEDYDNDPKSFDEKVAFAESVNSSNAFKFTSKEAIDKLYGYALWTGTNLSSYSIVKGYVDNKQIIFPEFYGAPTDTMSSKQATLDKMMLETYTKIIMGAVKVDEFDNFVNNWNSLGGDQITKEVNDWAASK